MRDGFGVSNGALGAVCCSLYYRSVSFGSCSRLTYIGGLGETGTSIRLCADSSANVPPLPTPILPFGCVWAIDINVFGRKDFGPRVPRRSVKVHSIRALMQLLHGGTSEHLTLRILHPLQARLPIFRSPIALEGSCHTYSKTLKKCRCRDDTMSCFGALTRSAGQRQGSRRHQEQKLEVGHVAGGETKALTHAKLLNPLNWTEPIYSGCYLL